MSFNVDLHVLNACDRLDRPDELAFTNVHPHTKLRLGQDYAVLGQIIDLSNYRGARPDIPATPTIPTNPLPEGVSVYLNDDAKPATRKDRYDSELTWAMAGDLAQIELVGYAGELSAGVKAYLGAISGETSVVVNTT